MGSPWHILGTIPRYNALLVSTETAIVISNKRYAKWVLTSTQDTKVPLASNFIRTIGKELSKDTNCILKSKMAADHLGKYNQFISREPFAIDIIIIQVFKANLR